MLKRHQSKGVFSSYSLLSPKSKKNVWEAVKKSYKLSSIIGQGAYGTVRKGICLKSGHSVAIKHISGFSKSIYDCIHLLREIQLMR